MSYDQDVAPYLPALKSSCIMHKCILKNDLESLKHMLSDSRRDCLNDLDYSGRTPLHVALQCANPKALYLILYYPLVHQSKLFATLDWTDLLDEPLHSSSSDFELEHSSNSSDSKPLDSHEGVANPTNDIDNMRDSNEQVSSNKSYKLGNMLLSHWEQTPSAYIRSALSLENDNYVYGCGVKEVDELYDEHYNFLVGNPHTLERAAREYTAKYSRLYANHPANLTRIKEMLAEDHLNIASNSHKGSGASTDASDERTDLHKGNKNHKNNGHRNNPFLKESSDVSSNSTQPHRLESTYTDSCVYYKKLMPLVMVDFIATFDKTTPLHLLFSNVYIVGYREKLIKCFRLLVNYFNKGVDFEKVFNTCDYNLYFNSKFIRCNLGNFNNYLSTFVNDKESLLKILPPKNDLTNAVPSPIKVDSTASHELNYNESCDKENTDNVQAPNSYISSTDNNSDRGVENAGLQWPNNTLCADARSVYQNRDKRRLSLINGRYSSEEFERVNGSFDSKVSEDTYRSTSKNRINLLHDALVSSSPWLRTHVSWETFIQKCDFSRCSILHKVCSIKNVKMIRLLLYCGFSPLVVNEAGDMPVHLAVESKDPYCLLTILHATLYALFYSRVASEDSMIGDSNADFISPLRHTFEYHQRNREFNVFMKKLSTPFLKTGDCFDDCGAKASLFYGDCSFSNKQNGTESIFDNMDPVLKQELFDEMLLLAEQLIYRAIRSSSWECIVAIFSYNAAITYHFLSQPSFMHRFINMAALINNVDEFMVVINFAVTNIVCYEDSNSQLEAFASFMHANIHSSRTQSPNDTTEFKRHCGIGGSYKGCGIPQSPLKSSSGSFSDSNFEHIFSSTHYLSSHNLLANILMKLKTQMESLNQKEPKKTWIITHPTCLHHLATPEPTDAPNKRNRLIVTYPENPTRLEVIISNDNGILRSDTLNNVKLIHSPPPASLADILRVHDWGYVDKLLGQIQIAQKRWATHPYWPVLADGDTPITPHSWNAALYAAGSVISAVDAVCTNACKNAFCAVRPPGHHLGTWGGAQSSNFEDEDFAAGSQGFCLINNVAIGAAYAKYTYGNKGIRRIAIVDFDVHHGNGTEQVIRNVGPKNIKRYVTHSIQDGEPFIDAHTIHKHWFGWRDETDAEDLLFASIHAYDGVFYPGTGKQCTIYDDSSHPNIINVAVPEGTTSSEFRVLFEKRIAPYVYHFKPDLIFISAGFDGHYRDSVSYGFTKYTEKDFYYVTERLVTIANSVSDGRIISVLEGGYNTKLNSLSPFARSVLEHVTALCNTNTKCNYPLMYGENSIDLLLPPILNQNFDLDAIEPINLDAKYDLSALDHIDGLRKQTELMISKAYSVEDVKYCKFPRLRKWDPTHTCANFSLELYGNFFFSFYSKYFYSLFNIATSVLFACPSISDSNSDYPDKEGSIGDFLSALYMSDPIRCDDHDIENFLISMKTRDHASEINKLLQCNKWFRDIKIRALKQNANVAELLYQYFSRNSSAFAKKCPIHT